MLQTKVGKNDLSVTIEASYSISFSWFVSYQSSTSLLLEISLGSVLQGGEQLIVKFINSKVFRGPYGG